MTENKTLSEKGNRSMRFASQTILWGQRPQDYAEMLSSIKENGYEGVEIAQAPYFLPDPKQLTKLLSFYDLQILSLCGGRLINRIKYCKEAGIEPLYYYVEKITDEILDIAKREEVQLALHPHVYNSIIREDILQECLAKHPEIKLIADTAHLYVAHLDSASIVNAYYNQLAAVHIKDWTSIYGRSFHRYARGFVLPGEGEVEPGKILNLLETRGYDGWVVIECDHTKKTPNEFFSLTRAWLQDNDIKLKKNAKLLQAPDGKAPWRSHNNEAENTGLITCAANSSENLCYEMLSSIRGDSLQDFGKSILKVLLRQLPDVSEAQIWEYSPSDKLLGLLAEFPNKVTDDDFTVLRAANEPLSEATERMDISRIRKEDLPNSPHVKWLKNFFEKNNYTEIIVLPVFNTYNLNQEQLLITLDCKKSCDAYSDTLLFDFADSIALAYELALDDLCQSFSLQIEQKNISSASFTRFLDNVREQIREMTNSEGASIFLADTSEMNLKCMSTSGLLWDSTLPLEKQVYQADDDSMTSKVWQTNEPVLIHSSVSGHVLKSEESVAQKNKPVCLIIPIRNQQGESIGVLRLRNKTKGAPMFTLSDMAIAESLCQAVFPNLLTIQQADSFRKTIDKVVHEIKMPLTGIRGASEVMKIEASKNGVRFSHDYLGDIEGWVRLQEQQIRRLDFFRYKISGRDEKLCPYIEPLWLLRDVIAPTKRHLRTLLRERNFSADKIEDDGMYNVPQVYVDKAMFQQIVFNLLGNAIKYCFYDPNSFQVNITSRRVADRILIIFDDYGMGIDEGYEHIIFDQYVRGPNAGQLDASGDGLGLWIVKELVELHKGNVSITHNKLPTRITISLPFMITEPNWDKQDIERKRK